MRNSILIAATVLFCSTAFAQEKAAPAKGTAPTSMKASNDLSDMQRKLSGELKGTLGSAEMLMAKAKDMTGVDPNNAEHYGQMVEEIMQIQTGLTEQLNLVNKATPENSKEVFAKAMEVNTGAAATLETFKKELMPAGK